MLEPPKPEKARIITTRAVTIPELLQALRETGIVAPGAAKTFAFAWSKWLSPGEEASLLVKVPYPWVKIPSYIEYEVYLARYIHLKWYRDEVLWMEDPALTSVRVDVPQPFSIRRSCEAVVKNTHTTDNNWVKVAGVVTWVREEYWNAIIRNIGEVLEAIK